MIVLWSTLAALAGSLTDLDTMKLPNRRVWDSAPMASMIRHGGNGPGITQYTIPSDPKIFGKYLASAVTYEYIDRRLGTVIAAFKLPYDAEGVRDDLFAAYGQPTFSEEGGALHVWRGDAVRLVWRKQADDLWIVTWSWLPLHGGDEETPPPQSEPNRTEPASKTAEPDGG